MNIEITPKKTDGLERLIEVTVPVETVRDAEDQAARRYASSVRLPGFRPGKAPPAMVKKRFKDAIRQQVIETLVQEAFKEVMDREQLKVASQPHVHDLKFEEGQPLFDRLKPRRRRFDVVRVLAQEPRRILGVRLIDQGVLLVGALGSAVVDAPVDVGGVLSRQELVGEREARPKAQRGQPQPKLPHGVTRR